LKFFVIIGFFILYLKNIVPTFVVDAPSGGGKIPVGPNYVISQSSQKTILRNFEGVITSYPEPKHYQEHDVTTCAFCQTAMP
jgi:lysine 2,3-aminomutase